MFEEEEVKPVDYVIVDHSILLKAVLFCRICHSDDVGFDQEVIRGACVSVRFVDAFSWKIVFQMNLKCNKCRTVWNWCSSRQITDKKSFMINRDISTACSVTGMPYRVRKIQWEKKKYVIQKFSTCFDTLRIPVLSETEHYKNIKKHVNSVVTEKYNKLQKHVLEAVINEAEKVGCKAKNIRKTCSSERITRSIRRCTVWFSWIFSSQLQVCSDWCGYKFCCGCRTLDENITNRQVTITNSKLTIFIVRILKKPRTEIFRCRSRKICEECWKYEAKYHCIIIDNRSRSHRWKTNGEKIPKSQIKIFLLETSV